LKVISPDRVENLSLRRRFELEARAASVLNHPSIVTIYDVGETEGISWIAMKWVDGRTLRDALLEGPLSIRDALSISSSRRQLRLLALGIPGFFPGRPVSPGHGELRGDDRIGRVNYWQAGGGLSYSLGPAGLFAAYSKYVWGRDAHNGQIYTLGATWYFDLRK
jgi:hypothetical protein